MIGYRIMENLNNIQKKINKIKKEISGIGELRPGSLSKQFNVCGKPKCKCKLPKNPQKHGPYYQISYTRKGKSTSTFVKPEAVKDIKKQLQNYKKLMQLVNQWIDLAIEQSKIKLDLIHKKTKAK